MEKYSSSKLPDVLMNGHLKRNGPRRAMAIDKPTTTLLYCSPNSSSHLWSFGLLDCASSVNCTILLNVDSFHVLVAYVKFRKKYKEKQHNRKSIFSCWSRNKASDRTLNHLSKGSCKRFIEKIIKGISIFIISKCGIPWQSFFHPHSLHHQEFCLQLLPLMVWLLQSSAQW